MTLRAAVEAYVTLKQTLGAVFSVDARILRSFARTVGDVPLDTLSAVACQAFCRGPGPPTRFSTRKHESLRGFFRYLVGRAHLRASPLPEPAPQAPSFFRPYIYSPDELRRLLDATATRAGRRALVPPETVRTLLLLLYGAGLRAGEALRLRRCDVDLRDRVLVIRETKFFQSRLVPIGTRLGAALARYATWREGLPLSAGGRSPFFATRTGQAVPLARLERAFVRLRQQAGVRRPAGDRWQPRLHDLRATFAVHRLLAWYREGVDLQRHLPLLATYLGHATVAGTQHYLTLTPELLAEASRRFQRYASPAAEEPHA